MLAEWAILSIDWFGDPQRLCAVRPTLRSVAQVWKGQGSSIDGIGTVRVPREEILREFPENPPPFLDDKGFDEAATVLIREAIAAANGRHVPQNTGAEIVQEERAGPVERERLLAQARAIGSLELMLWQGCNFNVLWEYRSRSGTEL